MDMDGAGARLPVNLEESSVTDVFVGFTVRSLVLECRIANGFYNAVKSFEKNGLDFMKLFCRECLSKVDDELNAVRTSESESTQSTTTQTDLPPLLPPATDDAHNADPSDPQMLPGQNVSHSLPTSPPMNDIRIIQGHKDVLSNFYPTPLTFKDNTTFDSVEQRYQYVRALRQKNHKVAEDILMAKHAGEVKAVSKGLFSDNRIADVELMMDILVTKLEQCSEFRDALRSTKNWSLVHSTSKADTFWASGLLPTDSHDSYSGQNVFGKCLEILRASLREEKTYSRKPPLKSLMTVRPVSYTHLTLPTTSRV